MAKVIEEQGPDAIAQRIGVDATGMRFNYHRLGRVCAEGTRRPRDKSIGDPAPIPRQHGSGQDPRRSGNKILSFHSDFAGRQLSVNKEVFDREAATNQRNQAIGSLMYAYGFIKENPAQATDIYTEQCAISVNAKDLAVMAATLANAGKNPVSRKTVMKAENVPEVLAVMATAGLYDDSGKWLYRTGLPAKSGVGGGIIAVSPGKFGIAVVSPPLDEAGNSVRAQKAITEISNALGGNPYAPRMN